MTHKLNEKVEDLYVTIIKDYLSNVLKLIVSDGAKRIQMSDRLATRKILLGIADTIMVSGDVDISITTKIRED